MAKKTSSQESPHQAADPHASLGHHAPVETEEQRQDREASDRVLARWARALTTPGRLIALVTGSLSLAWLASLRSAAPAMSWSWLLLLLLVFGWGLALARGTRAQPEDSFSPGGAH